MSKLFNWTDSFLTGLELVDEQHQELVSMINDLGELTLALDDFNQDKFDSARFALVSYVKHHFSEEMAQMKRIGLDRRHLEAHALEHKNFNEEVQLLTKLDDPLTHQQLQDMMNWLTNWLAYHILGMDQSMARQVRSIQRGVSATQAYDDDKKQIDLGAEPLIAALKVLFTTVSERNHSLRLMNRQLDERVKERTQELEESNRKLKELSILDELTGLHNRRYAISILEELWLKYSSEGKPMSVLLIDLDKFKPVNDTFGHAIGDLLLREVASRLKHSVRTSDYLCRMGGDEFLVICPDSGAKQVAEKILSMNHSFLSTDGKTIWDGSMSIGIAKTDDTITCYESLLIEADKLLYQVKQQGGKFTLL
ncbi:MAG: GGDEF domain-containing protein [Leptonema sp. (in: Bacteria)]|nr:GGDEF domain-containing protein [Leptonema sp. (in: bacteria)]